MQVNERLGWAAWTAVVGAILVVAGAWGLYGADQPEPRLEVGIVYRQVADETLRLDLARPVDGKGPFPAIIVIHGGGWTLGQRGSMTTFVKYFARQGYITATIDYRHSPKYRFPAHVEDVKTAVRYLRRNSDKLGIDPDRIGVLGFSAGGHLALMLGLCGPQDGFDEKSDAPNPSSAVQAVVNYFGSINFETWRVSDEAQQRIRKTYGGKSFEEVLAGVFGSYDPDAPVMRAASPATYADPKDPPVLTFHGTMDITVPFTQAQEFDRAMKSAGARHRLVSMEGEAHGWSGKALESTLASTLEFFDEHLKGHAAPRE